MILLLDIVERSPKVIFAAKHCLRFPETARRNVDRLAKVTYQIPSNVRCAPLPAMQKRNGTVNTTGHQCRTQRGAERARVDRRVSTG
jgi:hypothetical protein